MSYSWYAYIDESLDEGFKFDGENTSSRWFVISAVVVRARFDHEIREMMAKYRQDILKKPRNWSVHFQKLTHAKRLAWVNHIKDLRVRTVSILCSKPEMNRPDFLKQKSKLYFYLTRYLLERVTWVCRDNKRSDDTGDGTIKVTFSNRSSMKYGNLIVYMQRLKESRATQVDWSILHPDDKHIFTIPHKDSAGLQVVDAVASSYAQSVETLNLGYCDPQYAQIIGTYCVPAQKPKTHELRH